MKSEIIIKKLTYPDLIAIFKIEKTLYNFFWSKENFLYEIYNPHSYSYTISKNNHIFGYIISHIIFEKMFILP